MLSDFKYFNSSTKHCFSFSEQDIDYYVYLSLDQNKETSKATLELLTAYGDVIFNKSLYHADGLDFYDFIADSKVFFESPFKVAFLKAILVFLYNRSSKSYLSSLGIEPDLYSFALYFDRIQHD